MQKLIPHLWYDTQALEAAQLYVSLFDDSKILNEAMLYDTPSGDAQTVEFQLAGLQFASISAGPYFNFNETISLMVACETKDEVNHLYETLVKGGKVLMPLDEYSFSNWYGWISDCYGLNWQIMLVENMKEHTKIRPCILFSKEQCGKCEEAIAYYHKIFPQVETGYVNYYETGQAFDNRAKINYAELKLFDVNLVLMDHGIGGKETFNEAFSFMISCEDQSEIDQYWDALSCVPEAEACGWLKDCYGLSWQIVPKDLSMYLGHGSKEQVERVTKSFLQMKKFDIKTLEKAWKDE